MSIHPTAPWNGKLETMIPPEFGTFFVTSATAAAALIGLLFVAVSIAPEQTVMAGAPVQRQAVAASAFTALVNAFFVSLGAEIPHTNLGYFVCAMGVLGLVNTLHVLRSLLAARLRWRGLLPGLALVVVSISLYGPEAWQGVLLVRFPDHTGPLYTVDGLLMGIFGIALIRSWQLLGVHRYGLLAWMNPLGEGALNRQRAEQEKLDRQPTAPKGRSRRPR
jgi:hypothetical protein